MRAGHRIYLQRVAFAVVPSPRVNLSVLPSERRNLTCVASAMPGAPLDAAEGGDSHSERAWAYWRSLGAPKYHVAPMVDQVHPSPPTLTLLLLYGCTTGVASACVWQPRAPVNGALERLPIAARACCSRSCRSACCVGRTAQRRPTRRCFTPVSSQRWTSTGRSTSPAAQRRTGAAYGIITETQTSNLELEFQLQI